MTSQIAQYLNDLKKLWPHLSVVEKKRSLAFLKRMKKKIEKKHPEWKKRYKQKHL